MEAKMNGRGRRGRPIIVRRADLTLTAAEWQQKMASVQFLEEALSNDVDESAVNAIVGSLENQLVKSTSATSAQNNVINILQNELISIAPGPNASSGRQTQVLDSIRPSDVKILASNNPNISFHNVQCSQPTFVASMPKNSLGSIVKSSEPIKVIYSQPGQALGSGAGRVAFPALAHNVLQTAAAVRHPPLVLKQGAPGLQPGLVTVPMSVNASMPGAGAMQGVMTFSKQAQGPQSAAQPTLIPNVQILNMRPGAPGGAQPKSVATVSPRVVIGSSQVVGTRAQAPAITLQTLQGLQPGQQGHLLLKTENGQYQLLRVGPAPSAGAIAQPQPQSIRLSSVPALPGVATVSTSMAAPQMQTQLPPAPAPAPMVMPSQPPPPPPPAFTTVPTQKPSDNTKEKCRNFLANLLDLSSKEPKSVERNVRALIQELIDAQVEPEAFCDRLEKLLNASPQPCLIGFLKKSLPLLRQSMVNRELVIEGINAPTPKIVYSGAMPAQSTSAQLNTGMQMNYTGPTLAAPAMTQALPGKSINIISATQIHSPQVNSQPRAVSVAKSSGAVSKGAKSPVTVFSNMAVHGQKVIQRTKGQSSLAGKVNLVRSGVATGLQTVLTPGKSLLRDRERRVAAAPVHVFGAEDKMAGYDDINDVAAMGGVNLAEESQRILGSTELIGQQIRSCKDDYLVSVVQMQARARAASAQRGLDEPGADVAAMLSHALQEYLKNVVEQLVNVAQHKNSAMPEGRREATQDVKGQLKFLEDLDRVDRKRREDSEREILMRAAKSRSKNEDPEQAKLKAKAKEMQRIEMEEVRQREANLTALQAIGSRKRARLDTAEQPSTSGGGGGAGSGTQTPPPQPGRGQLALRSRHKRITHRDMLFLLERSMHLGLRTILYRNYLK